MWYKANCSTNFLIVISLFPCYHRESNPWPSECDANTLTSTLTGTSSLCVINALFYKFLVWYFNSTYFELQVYVKPTTQIFTNSFLTKGCFRKCTLRPSCCLNKGLAKYSFSRTIVFGVLISFYVIFETVVYLL